MTTKVILRGNKNLITLSCFCVYWTWCCYSRSSS